MMNFLSPQSRRSLIKCLVQFIDGEYSGKPTNADITNVCHATINLFSSLKVEKSDIGGIVRILLLVFVLIYCSSESNMNESIYQWIHFIHFEHIGFAVSWNSKKWIFIQCTELCKQEETKSMQTIGWVDERRGRVHRWGERRNLEIFQAVRAT